MFGVGTTRNWVSVKARNWDREALVVLLQDGKRRRDEHRGQNLDYSSTESSIGAYTYIGIPEGWSQLVNDDDDGNPYRVVKPRIL